VTKNNYDKIGVFYINVTIPHTNPQPVFSEY
jgi:hypothetical protein